MKITTVLPAGSEAQNTSIAVANDVAGRLKNAVAQAFAALQRAQSERRMREQLAGMDDSLLIDIGIERDEIIRVRAGERFTPRRWQDQLAAGGTSRR